jgi:polyhydroxyalkanoate synthase subunit PhaC
VGATAERRRRAESNGSTRDEPKLEDAPQRSAQSAGLDMLLTEAASGGPAQRWIPGMAGVKAAVKLAARPQTLARRTAGLTTELAKIAVGRSQVAPDKRDRRFKDPAWAGNPVYRRLGQTYLAWAKTLDRLVSDANLDWADERRLRFAAENLVDVAAPSNFPATNPSVVKAVIDSGGANLAKGAVQLAKDMRTSPRIPSMVDRSAFTVGENLALTEGAVVLRTEMFELLQYRPQTSQVYEHPMLVVPPMINKFYITDLAPDRSMVEHLVRSGQQVFAMSWRNPDERHAAWGLDEYAAAVVEAIDTTIEIANTDRTHVLGLCAGGITLSSALAHLAATGGQDKVAGLTLGVCVLDNSRSGTTSAFVDKRVARMAVADSARRGYLDGRALAGVFAWLRPNDLIWNYWVNNYLLGKEPPAFDILYWNADSTNLPAGLHRDFMEISLENPLVRKGALKVLGTPVDLSKVTVDSYIVAGIADHITPWENCYRTTQLLGSEPRFVLSRSGHIAALVNPPGNEKSTYQTAEHNPESAEEWIKSSARHNGTWWTDWAEWLSTRSGDKKRARKTLGSRNFRPLDRAPGTYVLEAAG